MIQDGWAVNGEVKLHYLDSGPAEANGEHPPTPLLIIPGMSKKAENFTHLMQAFAPRRTLTLSLRGHGQSDKPETGYGLDDLASDVETVIREAELERVYLFGHSIGVTYAIRCALSFQERHEERIAGLLVGDYPAHYPAIDPGWLLDVLDAYEGDIPPYVMLGLQQDSSDTPLWDALQRLTCPVLVMRGGQRSARLSEDGMRRYVQNLQDVETTVFKNAGNRLWHPDFEAFAERVTRFLNKHESSAN